MKSATARASSICKKATNPSAPSAAAISNLFKKRADPILTKSVRKRPFDPSSDCVVADQQSKKKAANNRMKGENVNVVLCKKKPKIVLKGRDRKRLKTDGRIVKLQFKRCMTVSQVQRTISSGFSFDVDAYQYLRCGQNNIMLVNEDQDLDGDDIVELAGQGSLYLAQQQASVSYNSCMLRPSRSWTETIMSAIIC